MLLVARTDSVECIDVVGLLPNTSSAVCSMLNESARLDRFSANRRRPRASTTLPEAVPASEPTRSPKAKLLSGNLVLVVFQLEVRQPRINRGCGSKILDDSPVLKSGIWRVLAKRNPEFYPFGH